MTRTIWPFSAASLGTWTGGTTTYSLARVSIGNIDSSRWSQAVTLSGTLVHLWPPMTCTGLSASMIVPVTSPL
jgi:hypothetical protein